MSPLRTAEPTVCYFLTESPSAIEDPTGGTEFPFPPTEATSPSPGSSISGSTGTADSPSGWDSCLSTPLTSSSDLSPPSTPDTHAPDDPVDTRVQTVPTPSAPLGQTGSSKANLLSESRVSSQLFTAGGRREKPIDPSDIQSLDLETWRLFSLPERIALLNADWSRCHEKYKDDFSRLGIDFTEATDNTAARLKPVSGHKPELSCTEETNQVTDSPDFLPTPSSDRVDVRRE